MTIPRGAVILDVGCGMKPYKDLFSEMTYMGIDIEGGGHPDTDKVVDTYFDGVNIPYESNKFHTVICTEVLEHSIDPERLIQEMNRVIMKGGKLYLTMPFVWNEHEVPYDFRRYTRFEHERVLKQYGFDVESIQHTNGVFGTAGQLVCAYVFESLKIRSTLFKFLLSIFVFVPILSMSILLDFLTKNTWITLGYIVIAKK